MEWCFSLLVGINNGSHTWCQCDANKNGINAIRSAFTHKHEREEERKKRQPIPPRRLYHNTIKSLSQFNVSTFFRSLNLKNERNNNNKCVLQKEQLTHPVEECTNQAKRERIGKSFFFFTGCCCWIVRTIFRNSIALSIDRNKYNYYPERRFKIPNEFSKRRCQPIWISVSIWRAVHFSRKCVRIQMKKEYLLPWPGSLLYCFCYFCDLISSTSESPYHWWSFFPIPCSYCLISDVIFGLYFV